MYKYKCTHTHAHTHTRARARARVLGSSNGIVILGYSFQKWFYSIVISTACNLY